MRNNIGTAQFAHPSDPILQCADRDSAPTVADTNVSFSHVSMSNK